MLFVYTRHTKDCSKKGDLFCKRCRCPKWLDGTLAGNEGRYRVSARIRSWEKAEELRRELEANAEHRLQQLNAGNAPPAQTAPVSSAQAVERFLAGKRNENLAESTLAKLETIFQKQFLGWCQSVGLYHLAQITTQHLEEFRDTWLDDPPCQKEEARMLDRLLLLLYSTWMDKRKPSSQSWPHQS